jgi:hypothetical protein
MRSSFSTRTKTLTARGSSRQRRATRSASVSRRLMRSWASSPVDRPGDPVVGDDLIDVVGLGRRVVTDLEHHVEAHPLLDPALAREGADLDPWRT